ncbi:MAG TPA: hypothetical protein VFR34_08400 [Paracoccaceae bacterium]|nr:hypothetical protein [Paracoccaceae bacterium]
MSGSGELPQGQSVDDVLSAIRRLVTEEEEQRRLGVPAEEQALILTSEMREDGEGALRLDPALHAAPEAPPAGPGEDALTALVRRIVREEIEFAMGERVSASLRKFVRREISRAMNLRMME